MFGPFYLGLGVGLVIGFLACFMWLAFCGREIRTEKEGGE